MQRRKPKGSVAQMLSKKRKLEAAAAAAPVMDPIGQFDNWIGQLRVFRQQGFLDSQTEKQNLLQRVIEELK